jgi:hypothetical protein
LKQILLFFLVLCNDAAVVEKKIREVATAKIIIIMEKYDDFTKSSIEVV